MAEQIPFVIAELKRNPFSRRAVIDIRDWKKDSEGGEPACLQHIQYFVRKDKLDCVVLFRSNDACKATFMNAFALIMLQKRIADELGYEVGTYTHRANSFHCYEKDIPLLQGYVNRIDFDKELTYNYVGEWDELMEEAKGEIAEMVAELKGREDE
jgi:thymidylate synthase